MKADLDRVISELTVLRGIANQCPDSAVRIQLQGKINTIERHVKLAAAK